jgi:Cu/Ag efflux pump CusA
VVADVTIFGVVEIDEPCGVRPDQDVRRRGHVRDIAWRDLGSVSGAIESIAKEAGRSLPPGGQVLVMGQIESMKSAYAGIGLGLLLAVLLVYALMVANFQSWLDPFMILLALPGAGAGILECCRWFSVTGREARRTRRSRDRRSAGWSFPGERAAQRDGGG